MSDNKFKCGCPNNFYKKKLAEAEDWEVKKKEKLKEILSGDKHPECLGHEKVDPGQQKSTWIYSTGGKGTTFLACPNGCGKMYKKVTEFGDELELEHECKQSNNSIGERERERERANQILPEIQLHSIHHSPSQWRIIN